MTAPIILLPACTQTIHHHTYHVVQHKYIHAVAHAAKCVPLILPALAEHTDWSTLLSMVDGILLTGSESNVNPRHFNQSVWDANLPLDPARDATTLPLIQQAVKRSIPLFAICRGTQEINVALGGSLHQAVHTVSGMMDHRENKTAPLEEQYAPAHTVTIAARGKLAHILGDQDTIMVNSVHGQGIDQLAQGLQIEATANDGLVEAYSISQSTGFSLAVQWHPEWQVENNPISMKLFHAFGEACRTFQKNKA